jgi:hypothetical protein
MAHEAMSCRGVNGGKGFEYLVGGWSLMEALSSLSHAEHAGVHLLHDLHEDLLLRLARVEERGELLVRFRYRVQPSLPRGRLEDFRHKVFILPIPGGRAGGVGGGFGVWWTTRFLLGLVFVPHHAYAT